MGAQPSDALARVVIIPGAPPISLPLSTAIGLPTPPLPLRIAVMLPGAPQFVMRPLGDQY
jgi:hypothetical protein